MHHGVNIFGGRRHCVSKPRWGGGILSHGSGPTLGFELAETIVLSNAIVTTDWDNRFFKAGPEGPKRHLGYITAGHLEAVRLPPAVGWLSGAFGQETPPSVATHHPQFPVLPGPSTSPDRKQKKAILACGNPSVRYTCDFTWRNSLPVYKASLPHTPSTNCQPVHQPPP